MSTLVIGSTGFVGGYYKKYSKKKNIFYTSSKKRKNYIKFDLLKDNINKIILNKKIDKVVFLSAISNPYECEKNKKKSNLVNLTMTKKVIRYLIKQKIYFIFFSSEYVFDGKNGNYLENSPKKSNILYGKQKIIIENFLKKLKGNFSVLRIGKTYGNSINDKSIFSNFVKDLIKGKKIFTFAYDQKFSALNVLDLVNIIDTFLNKKINSIFNICGNDCCSRFNYMERIVKFLKIKDVKLKKEKFNNISKMKKIPLNVCMINNKIKKKINFKFTKFEKYLNITFGKYEKKS